MKHRYIDGFNVMGLVYNVPEVIAMSARVESILQACTELTREEWEYLLVRLADKLELWGWQKVSEPVFRDWDNEDDDAYNDL